MILGVGVFSYERGIPVHSVLIHAAAWVAEIRGDRVLDGPASGEKGSQGRN